MLAAAAPHPAPFHEVDELHLPPTSTVWALHEDTAGRIWMATDVGLARLEPEASSLRLFETSSLRGTIVYSLLQDSTGSTWLGTSRGLVRFEDRTEAFRTYDEADGVGNVEFNRRAALVTTGGYFLFGGISSSSSARRCTTSRGMPRPRTFTSSSTTTAHS